MLELKPNPNNPRTISEEGFSRLKAKIKRNPDGLTANKIVHKDGIIIAGNQRWRALQELGLKLKDDWFKDVSDWTEDQIKEYLIISNITDGEWDYSILANEWDTDLLKDWGIDLPSEEPKPKEANKMLVCPECGHENTPSAFKPIN